jgi:hypothetical protein
LKEISATHLWPAPKKELQKSMSKLQKLQLSCWKIYFNPKEVVEIQK